MVFVFESNGPRDGHLGVGAKPFRFKMAVGAELTMKDWNYSGRNKKSRRTITASVTGLGYEKMTQNWIYLAPDVRRALGK